MDPFRSPYDAEPLQNWAKDQPIATLPALFLSTVKASADQPFLGAKHNGAYVYQSYRQVADQVRQFAAAVCQQGISAQDRVAQICNNRPEWVITDLGTMSAGAVHVPLYSTVSDEAFTYILNDSEARLLVLETPAHWELLKRCAAKLPHLRAAVALCPFDASDLTIPVWSWQDFLSLGQSALPEQNSAIEARSAALVATDVCSLVYTSGTTGEPKGAMLMHGNFLHNAVSVRPSIKVEPGDIELSFLPLSHVFERTLYYVVMSLGATIAYAQSMETVRDDILEVRPQLVASVPRLYEKIMAAVVQKAQHAPNLRRTRAHLFDWALETGKRHARAKWAGYIPLALALEYKLATKLVLGKIHAATGGRIKVFASGGAPLRADVCEFFLSAGFTLIEGYGLTETSPVITINPPERPKIGTVGTKIKDVELKIAEDGEILSRGPHIMLGYFNKPKATEEVIDSERWFHTGDIGEMDKDGYLKITDRKKELLVLSNGKNVAPSPIEQAIKKSPYIEQAVVIGDNHNFVAALVVPSYDGLKSWCASNGVSSDPAAMAGDPKLVAMLTEETVKACQRFSHFEQVKKIAVLPRELSQHDGELTPTLKVKRRVVNTHFKDHIEAIYAPGEP
jgi:long-chain acyl-CoA synthetase